MRRLWQKTCLQISTGFNENLSAYKANRSSGVGTINVNSTRHTSTTNASGEEDTNSGSSQGENDMRKAKRKRLLSKFQKSKTQVRDTGEHRPPPPEDELSLYGGFNVMIRLKDLLILPSLPMQRWLH